MIKDIGKVITRCDTAEQWAKVVEYQTHFNHRWMNPKELPTLIEAGRRIPCTVALCDNFHYSSELSIDFGSRYEGFKYMPFEEFEKLAFGEDETILLI